jgi:hypothetical protein
MGEGDQGQKCGRGDCCLGAVERELETDLHVPLTSPEQLMRLPVSTITVLDYPDNQQPGETIGYADPAETTTTTTTTAAAITTPSIEPASTPDTTTTVADPLPSPTLPASVTAAAVVSSSPSLYTPTSPESRKSPAGYLSQEIEGIGGGFKQKAKTRVRIGATVSMYEDERLSGEQLEREATGKVRSWCSWCQRVVPKAGEQP